MIKIILAILVLSITNITQAEYFIKVPLEQSSGGPLPNGSIKMPNRTPGLPSENWKSVESIYSEWVNEGVIYGCSDWAPSTDESLVGHTFTQYAYNCSQHQTRTNQNREQEQTTFEYRNIGIPMKETQSITVPSTQLVTGTSACLYNPANMWRNMGSGLNIYINNVLTSESVTSAISIEYEGLIYTRGAMKYTDDMFTFYEVCSQI